MWAAGASGQSSAVVYTNDFQAYAAPVNAAGWSDTSSGGTKSRVDHLFKTWPDPQQGSGANIVYGVKQATGNAVGGEPRSGRFSTYTGATFSGAGRFEYRGHFLRTSANGHMGVTFFSSLPDTLSGYVVGLRQEPFGAATMQLFTIGDGALVGTVDSHFTPEVNRWYDFLIRADDLDGATNIRARFWLYGTQEPATFSIDAKDTNASRLIRGRIGIWSASNSDAYVDDLIATSAAVERTSSSVTFIEEIGRAHV